VAVIGGGNTAVEEALYLSNIARKVYLVHRRDFLRAEKIMQDKLFEKVKAGKIDRSGTTRWTRCWGRHGRHRPCASPARWTAAPARLKVHGFLHRHRPHAQHLMFEGQLAIQERLPQHQSGLEGNATQTSVPGVFAAGDVADQVYRQAITSAGFGCMAALDAEKFLDEAH
jgi:thioredoxin reductase (NADPH)